MLILSHFKVHISHLFSLRFTVLELTISKALVYSSIGVTVTEELSCFLNIKKV